MRPLVYDFAMTLDGFICREDGSADGFVPDGDHLTDYLNRLERYDTVLMGRKTYEFGYEFGLKPGERAYPHMEHYIFSSTLALDSDDLNVLAPDQLEMVPRLKEAAGAPIYLCGGGVLAGALLEREWINQLVIKLNPVLFGGGRGPFGDSSKQVDLRLLESKPYDNGVTLLRYDVNYAG